MKVQPSLKFLVKDNVQLENDAQILVLNFIITLLASDIQAFTLPFAAGPSAANQGHAGLGFIWFPISRLSVEWELQHFLHFQGPAPDSHD